MTDETIATRAYALGAFEVAIRRAEEFALAAGLDESVTNDLHHLLATAWANMEGER